MRPFRCQICGETYMGSSHPDRCPFCGAAGQNLKAAAEWIDYDGLSVSAKSKELIEKALGLEIENAAFYKACANAAETQITVSIFKRLGKQELEHAEVFADLIGVEEPELILPEVSGSDEEKFVKAHHMEQEAIKFYLQAAKEAVEPRVQEVFRAISEIESEHMIVSNMYK